MEWKYKQTDTDLTYPKALEYKSTGSLGVPKGVIVVLLWLRQHHTNTQTLIHTHLEDFCTGAQDKHL